jgi:hypothetical protein
MDLTDFLLSFGWSLATLFVWFHTDAIVSYLKLVFPRSSILNDYDKFVEDHSGLYFPVFLYYRYKDCSSRFVVFLVKLQNCPYCLGFWICLLWGTVFAGFWTVGLLYCATLAVFSVVQRVV